MKLSSTLATAALTTALTIGGATAAFATGNDGGTGEAAKIEQLCAHKDTIIEHLTTRQTKLTERIATATTAKQSALDAGKPKLAARIAVRIRHLNRELDRVTNRLEKAPALIAQYCTTG